MISKYYINLLFFFPLLLFGKIQYSHKGYFDLGSIHRLSDASLIKIPYRMATYESNTSYNNFNLYLSTALEFRLMDANNLFNSKLLLDLREIYLEWLIPIGDISLGKQIITWGSASVNNPTDIISPYNYYYLFSKGKEQKEGLLSLNSNLYINNIKMNFIFIPNHNFHIIPINDKEFPIGIPIEDPGTNELISISNNQIDNLNNIYEYGLSITLPFSLFDFTTSYFSGYDRAFSFFGANLWTGANSNPDAIKTDIVLSYRKTNMIGLGLSGIINNLSYRLDFGYFKTDDNLNNISDSTLYRYWEAGVKEIELQCEESNEASSWNPIFVPMNCNNYAKFNNSQPIDNKANFKQYTLELEYSPTYDLKIISQISTSKLIEIGKADSIITSRETIMFDPLDYFIPGIGIPNSFITERSLTLLLEKEFHDLNFKCQFFSIIDLDKKGSINEINVEYKIFNNTKLIMAVNKIYDNNNIKLNPFSEMKDFSHFRAEIKYFY